MAKNLRFKYISEDRDERKGEKDRNNKETQIEDGKEKSTYCSLPLKWSSSCRLYGQQVSNEFRPTK